MKKKKEELDVDFITKEELIQRLEISDTTINIQYAFEQLNTNWKVESIRQERKRLYKVSDVERIEKEVKDFYDRIYCLDEIKARLPQMSPVQLFNLFQFKKISDKYNKFLMSTYNPGKEQIYVEKEYADKILLKIEKVQIQDTKDEAIYFQGKYYYTIEGIRKRFCIPPETSDDNICRSCSMGNITSKKIRAALIGFGSVNHVKTLYLKEEIDDIWNRIQYIQENYYPKNELKNIKKTLIHKFNEVLEIELLLCKWITIMGGPKGNKIYYKKTEVDGYINNISETYSYLEAIEKLCVSRYKFKEIVENYNIESIKINGRNKYYKDAIDELFIRKQKFYDQYMTIAEICEYLDVNNINPYMINGEVLVRHPIPLYAQDTKHILAKFVYAKEDVYKRIKEYNDKSIREYQVGLSSAQKVALGESPSITFYARLNTHTGWDGFDDESKYTEKSWFQFVEAWLSRTNATKQRVNLLINKLVKTTPLIKDMLIKNSKAEVYMLTGKEIELYMKGINIQYICYVIELYMKDVAINCTHKGKRIKPQDIPLAEKVCTKNKNTKRNEEEDIYSFEEYQLVFNYCIAIKEHVERGIHDFKATGKKRYFSMWLYVIVHLNNAWRHGDIVDFPIIEVGDLIDEYKISDIEWFLNNEVTLKMSRRVMLRVHQWEIKIAKTKVEGAFFCSDLVMPAFATAVLILFLLWKDNELYKDRFIDFNTKYNKPHKGHKDKFFWAEEFKDFNFLSLKFNRTVMTYTYYISNLSGDQKSLLYAAKLRGHKNKMTTISHYVKVNKKAIDQLSLQLLKRGEFGFVTAMLINRLNGEELGFEDLTQKVEAINNNFGHIVKVNSAIGFLNTLRSEQREVFRQINNMTFEEIQELLTDIYLRKVPSKDSKEILCAYGRDKCIDHNKACFDCMYHIPTIYSLTYLYGVLCQDIKEYSRCTMPAKKINILFRIERKKQIIREAMDKFGKEAVYDCFECTREEFINMLAQLPSSSEIALLLEER